MPSQKIILLCVSVFMLTNFTLANASDNSSYYSKHSCYDPMCGIQTNDHSHKSYDSVNGCTMGTISCQCEKVDAAGNSIATADDMHKTGADCSSMCTLDDYCSFKGGGEENDEQVDYTSVITLPTYPQTLALVEHHKATLLGLDSFAAERLEDYKSQQLSSSRAANKSLDILLNAVIKAEHETLIGTCSFDFTAVLLNAVDQAYQAANQVDVGSNRTNTLPSPESVLFYLNEVEQQ